VRQGLRSEQLSRRFVQERQILARLQHPAIARLLDGGVTTDGTPFLVMEYVEGRPVTTYCAARALTIAERLRVFLAICDAVQYAHRNLIVHRDLKPANILVDEHGRVTLLDFGIATLLGDDSAPAGAPQTMVRALTPDYAAPEQLRGEPVSTSTDVYALGVLLYELLVEKRPYRVQGSAAGALERAILEEEPLAPSAHAESKEQRRRVRGDLDRIVMKALQKPAERRYPSAEALATDVRRHLGGLPVSARGDAFSYRAWKFLGRHRVGAGAAALLVLTLVGGLIATGWEARRAEREARKAEAVKEFLKTLLSSANPELAKGREPSVRQLLDAGASRIDTDLQGQPEVQSEVAQVVATAYQALGQYDQVTRLMRADVDRRRRIAGPRSTTVAEALTQIADALYEKSQYSEAGPMYEEALAIQRERRGAESPEVAELLWDIAGVKRNGGDLVSAETLEKQALAIYVQVRGDESADAASVRESLAITYGQGGRFAEAAALQAPVVAWRERHHGLDHPSTLTGRYNLAYNLLDLGRFAESAHMLEDVIARQRRVLGPRHDRLAVSLRLLARTLDSSGRAEEALAPIAEALAIQAEEFGPRHLQVASNLAWQSVIEADTGRLAQAERDCREALSFFDAETTRRADLPNVRAHLAVVLAETGHLGEAEAQLSRAVADLRAGHHQGPFLGYALDALGDVVRRRAQTARAAELTRESLTILERSLGRDHPTTVRSRVHAGAAQSAIGHAAEGEDLMRAGLTQLTDLFPAGHPDVASAQVALAEALAAQGRSNDAIPLFQQALTWRRGHFGATDPRTEAVQRALRLYNSPSKGGSR